MTILSNDCDRSAGFQPAVPLASSRRSLFLLVVGLALLLTSAAPAFAQGCAMCYSNAAGSAKDGQRAISKAILVLLLPPLGFMTVGMGMAFRYGRKRDEESDTLLDISTENREQ